LSILLTIQPQSPYELSQQRVAQKLSFSQTAAPPRCGMTSSSLQADSILEIEFEDLSFTLQEGAHTALTAIILRPRQHETSDLYRFGAL